MRWTLASCLTLLLIAGCRERPPGGDADAPPRPEAGDAADTAQLVEGADGVNAYTVRGIVKDLPREGAPASDFRVFHEAIPEFVHSDGTPGGMGAMQMGFSYPDEGFGDLRVGDKIQFRWLVRWEGRTPRSRVTDVEVLPPDTELDLPGTVTGEDDDAPGGEG